MSSPISAVLHDSVVKYDSNMKVFLSQFTFLMISTACLVGCGQYKPVELAHELRELGVSDWLIPLLVCLASESDLNSEVVTSVTPEDGSKVYLYGLFNFPEDVLSPCNLTREEATDGDITDDVNCMMTLLKNNESRKEILEALPLDKCFAQWNHLPPFLHVAGSRLARMQIRTPDDGSSPDGYLTIGKFPVVLLLVILTVVVIIFILNCLMVLRPKDFTFCASHRNQDNLDIHLLENRYQMNAQPNSDVPARSVYDNYPAIPKID